MRSRKSKIFFDVQVPHKKSRRPFLYKFPVLVRFSHHPFILQRKYTIATIAVLLIVATVFGSGAYYLLANTRTLYPVSCSGDFADATSLSEETGGRARANASGQKLFCSFETLTIKEHVPIVRATLVVRFDEPQTQQVDVEESADEPPHEQGTDTTESSVQEESESTSEPIEEPTIEEESITVGSEEPNIIESTEQTPEPSIESEPSPDEEPIQETSIQPFFFSTAHAQEVGVETPEPEIVESTDVEPSVPEEEPVESTEPIETTDPEETEGEVLSETVEVEEERHLHEEEQSMVSLSYTIDGVLWSDVSSFSPRGNEVTFDIIVPTTKDLEKLVVRVAADHIVEEVAISYLAVRIETEAPLQDVLLPEEEIVLEGEHVYTRQFTVDKDATHSCTPEPLTINLSSATTTVDVLVRLSYGEDVGQGITGIISNASRMALTLFEDESEALQEPVENSEVVTTIDETATTSVMEQAVEEEVPVPADDPALEEVELEQVVESEEVSDVTDTEVLSTEQTITEENSILSTVSHIVKDTLEDVARIQVGQLEVGNLPKGIDVRFQATSSPYVKELFDTDPPQVFLTARVYAREFAQKGSFSVPLIFTRTDGGVSDVVCQINIVNRPESQDDI